METQRTPVEVFYSCSDSPTDAPLLEQLERHLKALQREGLIATWHKRQIVAGSVRQAELDRHLNTAALILLLVSSDFLASDYYGIEMRRALQRHAAKEAQVIPILLRQCIWESAPFADLEMLPTGAKPITLWRNRDAAWTDVVTRIRQALGGKPKAKVPGPGTPIWNVPYRRNPHFTGRDELLDQLAQQLTPKAQEHGATTRQAALTQAMKGLGGIGKTQIAVEYAYRSQDLGWYTHTFWVNASEETLLTSFASLADLLPAFPAKGETDQQKLVKAIKGWLEQCQEQWLLIFDNADELALVSDYLPQRGNGSILLTTRANAVGALATPVEVETMSFVEGTQLLLRRAQRFEHASDEEVNQAGNIVVALDHFPLALDQAGAYIEETQCSFEDYLGLYQTHRQVLLAQRGMQATGYPDSVATTWLLSFQKVEQANPAAAELLHLCAFLAPDRIPEELFRDGSAFWPVSLQQAVVDPLTFQQLIADLLKFSLVKRLMEEHVLSIHRLVQAVQKDWLEPETQQQWAGRVVRAIDAVFPNDPQNLAAWPQCLRYLDQAQACHTLIAHYDLALVEGANILNQASVYLQVHALYAIAEPLLMRALSIREQQLGAEHPSTAASLNNLAELYRAQSRHEEAEPLYQRALRIVEQQLGAEHPITATSLNNLALLYYQQGRYGEAVPLFVRALASYEQQLGAEHPQTARSLNNLAELYRAQGRYGEAEPLFVRALAICEQQLGAEHPQTAESLNNLALLYYQQGRYEEAEPLFVRVLRIYEQQLGTEHPSTATSLNNLAELYRAQSRHEETEPLLMRALSIQEQQLGTEHPQTAGSLNNLAGCYYEQGKYGEAEPLYKRALRIAEQQLGAEHPQTAFSLRNLAYLYQQQGRYREAELLYQRALPICDRALGSQHPVTQTVRAHYTALLFLLKLSDWSSS